jgi:hypothetical protein
MKKSESFLFLLSVERYRENTTPGNIGLLIGLVSPEGAIIPADDFQLAMWEEYDANETVYAICDLKNEKGDDYFPFYVPITPVLLFRDTLPFKAASAAGLQLKEYEMGDPVYGNISSVWQPTETTGNAAAPPNSEFLYTVLTRARAWAIKRQAHVHLGLTIGWDYDHGIGKLDKLPEKEVLENGRVIWQRTPEG